MPSTVKLYLLVGFVCLVVFALVVAKQLVYRKFLGKDDASTHGKFRAKYRVRGAVLSPAERAFVVALQEAIVVSGRSGSVVMYPSVRLAEVLEVDSSEAGDRSARQSAFNRISSKQADFVLCDEMTTRPLLVVELDDSSHLRRDRADRDEFVDYACASAGLAILHIKVAAKYDARALAARLVETLGSTR